MHTPFDFEHADPWSSDIVDVESLNHHVSDRILARIDEVRDASTKGPAALRSSTLLVLGPAGAGKTHLFVRLRRRCGPRAAFVLVRPTIGVPPTPRHVLAGVLDALQHPASGTTDRQLDLVVGSMLAAVQGSTPSWPHVLLEHYRAASPGEVSVLVEAGIEQLESLYPEVSPTYLEQLLQVPFLKGADRRAAVAWLSGREPSEAQLARLGLRAVLDDVDVLPALSSLATVAAYGAPITLVFDQLENLVDADDEGQRVLAHGNLVSELFDSVRGLVIAQMALDDEWKRRIRPILSASQRSRVEASVCELELPTAEQREELIRAWVGRLPEVERSEPFPHPFSEERIGAWTSAAVMTPRMLMIACREAYEAGPEATVELDPEPSSRGSELSERLQSLWEAQFLRARRELSNLAEDARGVDAERLVSGILVALKHQGHLVRRLRAGRETAVFVERHGVEVELRMLQQRHGVSVAAAIRRAIEAAKDRHVWLVRDRTLEFPPSWKRVTELQRSFMREPQGHFLYVDHHDVARLVAFHDFLSAARSQDLAGPDGRPIAPDMVDAWVRQSLGYDAWSLVQQVLGDAPADDESESLTSVPSVQVMGSASAVLGRLRLASVDRITREVSKVIPEATRAGVRKELESLGESVHWFGRSLVCMAEVLR